MPRVAFIGAGSLGFASKLMVDMLSFPALADTTFAFMDIDPQRLDYARRIGERILEAKGGRGRLEATLDRREALRGADFVVVMILAHGFEPIRREIEIPLKYGIDQSIGDTLGPGGVFRALRTVPIMLDICRDVEELCPEAWLLNYTNPMAILCWAMDKASPVRKVGLCHSVQGTARQLAGYMGVPVEELDYWVAGINHQAWFLRLVWRGQDVYPLLREAIARPEVYDHDTTRCEMCRHLGYFVTESSGHNSEYNPWFRKRRDLLAKYTRHGGWNGESGYILKLYGSDRENWEQEMERKASGDEPLPLERSQEYGAFILNALAGGEPYCFNGNVLNSGLIPNLPQGCCVEVPCYADRRGIHPLYVGALPPQLAALNRSNISVQELAVQAALENDRDKAFWAVAYDPLTAAVLSLEEIRSLVDELFAAEAPWLPQFQPKAVFPLSRVDLTSPDSATPR